MGINIDQEFKKLIKLQSFLLEKMVIKNQNRWPTNIKTNTA